MGTILGPCLHLVFRSVSGNHKQSAETQDCSHLTAVCMMETQNIWVFFNWFDTIFTSNWYIFKTLSTNITTDHQKCTSFKHFSMFLIVLVQYTQSQSILFTTQNNCFIYINVSFTVTAFHNALTIKLFICMSSHSVSYICLLFTLTHLNG